MEHTLYEIKKKNQKKKICSVRFTNVSFSKGSILKSIYDKCITGGTFGIPSNVKRHFITHNEAASLCFKSILKECENGIILPNPDKIGEAKSILVLCKKILKKFNINFKRNSSGYYSKGLKVKFVKALTYGQKYVEDLSVNDEIYSYLKDDVLIKTSFKKFNSYDLVLKKINSKNFFNTNKLIKLFFPDFRSGNHKKIKLSENI
jgi:FlaA1/EpsC-like NDP-sugar epimerase